MLSKAEFIAAVVRVADLHGQVDLHGTKAHPGYWRLHPTTHRWVAGKKPKNAHPKSGKAASGRPMVGRITWGNGIKTQRKLRVAGKEELRVSQLLVKTPGAKGNASNLIYRGKAKASISRKVSALAGHGVTAVEVSNTLESWANSSNHGRALLYQRTTSSVLGLDGSNSWQAKLFRGVAYEDQVNWDELEPVERTMSKAMYSNTQSWLKANKVKSLTLYRGVTITPMKRFKPGDVIEYHSNYLTSWTTNIYEAANFGDSIISATFPASRIYSTAQTGLGCLDELEVVITGGELYTDTATIYETGDWAVESSLYPHNPHANVPPVESPEWEPPANMTKPVEQMEDKRFVCEENPVSAEWMRAVRIKKGDQATELAACALAKQILRNEAHMTRRQAHAKK